MNVCFVGPRGLRRSPSGTRDVGQGRTGFTMIEMLIVVGIIAVLVSMVFPLVGKIREQARAAACQSNERQIYLASVAFSADHGRLPRPPRVWDAASSTDPVVRDWNIWQHKGAGLIDLDAGVIWKYLSPSHEGRSQVVNCPSDIEEQLHYNGYQKIIRDFSYSLNARISDETPNAISTLRLGDISNPSQKIMIWEEIGPNDSYCLDPIYADRWDDQPTGRHGGGALNREDNPNPTNKNKYRVAGKGCYAFFDGHTEAITPVDIFANPACYAPLR